MLAVLALATSMLQWMSGVPLWREVRMFVTLIMSPMVVQWESLLGRPQRLFTIMMTMMCTMLGLDRIELRSLSRSTFDANNLERLLWMLAR